jgi:hypothetical protein
MGDKGNRKRKSYAIQHSQRRHQRPQALEGFFEPEIKTIETREAKELLAIVQVTTSVRRKVTRASLNVVTAISPRCVHRGR